MTAPWLFIQHVAWEGPGVIAAEADRRGIALESVRLDHRQAIPALSELPRFGGLIVMGGPMSANDAHLFPWLLAERGLLGTAVSRDLPVLGVCLGAQQLAAALGARVYRGPVPEIGFGKVLLTSEGRRDPVLGGTESLLVFHWHAETFELPPGATLLASSEHYRNQAFRIGRCIYGLQFHVEIDASLGSAWAPHLPEDVVLSESDREQVERTGRLIIGRFFDSALNLARQKRRGQS